MSGYSHIRRQQVILVVTVEQQVDKRLLQTRSLHIFLNIYILLVNAHIKLRAKAVPVTL